jgi:glucose dehydrogenase
MKLATYLVASAAIAITGSASANEALVQLPSNSELWPMQLGNYQGHRHSRLDRINTENVGDLRVAWQFSTGVLRGHEGFGFLLDRETGELLLAEKFAPETNWAERYDLETGRPVVDPRYSTFRRARA